MGIGFQELIIPIAVVIIFALFGKNLIPRLFTGLRDSLRALRKEGKKTINELSGDTDEKHVESTVINEG